MFAVLHIADFALHAVLRTEALTPTVPAALFDGHGKKSLILAVEHQNHRALIDGHPGSWADASPPILLKK